MVVILCPLSHIHSRVQMMSSSQVLSIHHTSQEGSTLQIYAIRLKEVAGESLCISLKKLCVYHE